MSNANIIISKNLRELRKFLASTGKLFSQAQIGEMIGVTTQTYGGWENGRGITDAGNTKIVSWINAYFINHSVKITVEDLTGPDLVKKLKEQIRASLHPAPPKVESYSKIQLKELLADVETCRLLGITDAQKDALTEKLEIVRDDLDKDDWIDLYRTLAAGRWEIDGWMFTEPSIVGQRVRFKSDRVLKPSELEKVNKIVQSVVNELREEERKKRRGDET